jgi:hypothetical protein
VTHIRHWRRPTHVRPTRHNLSRLIGRDAEVRQIIELLLQDRAPLVTLVGLGGIGKTRLAVHVVDTVLAAFPGGAWLVDLALAPPGRLVIAADDAASQVATPLMFPTIMRIGPDGAVHVANFSVGGDLGSGSIVRVNM